MTDKELLELAAKAAQLPDAKWDDYLGLVYTAENGIKECPWNPLEYDGAALWLAVKLHLDINAYPLSGETSACRYHHGITGRCIEKTRDDPYAATRRAIVRAAAEIGRTV